MSAEKISFPYGYENVSLFESESSQLCDEAEEKVIRLALEALINYVLSVASISARSNLYFCSQRCMFASDDNIQHDKTSSDAKRKLIFAAILSVVFMVRDFTFK